MMQRAYELLSSEEPDEDLAWLAAQLGRFLFFAGQVTTGAERIEAALVIAESLQLPEVLSQALNTKSLTLFSSGRKLEGYTLLRYALEAALENDKPSAALRAYYNIADLLPHLDRYEEAVTHDRSGLELARRVGNRFWELSFLGHGYALFSLGEWDEAVARAEGILSDDWTSSRSAFVPYLMTTVLIRVHRGHVESASEVVDFFGDMAGSAEIQEQLVHASSRAAVLLESGDPAGALEAAETAIDDRSVLGIGHEAVKEAFVTACEAALRLEDLDRVERLLDLVGTLPPGERTQFLDAHWTRFRARLDVRQGTTEHVESRFKQAAGSFREISVPFYLAATLLDYGRWLIAEGRDRDAGSALDEARGVFQRLGARPWLERLDELAVSPRVGSR
jgi:tetratricopeptide (TPR) repeat protein